MTRYLKCGGTLIVAGLVAIAVATPSYARHKRHHVVVVTPVVVEKPGIYPSGPGGYYSSVYDPRFGYVPELGYSNAVMFTVYPRSDD